MPPGMPPGMPPYYGMGGQPGVPPRGFPQPDAQGMGAVASGTQGTAKKKAKSSAKKKGKKDGSDGTVTGRHTRTTLLLKNLPADFSRDKVSALLDKEGFRGLYNFVYVPACLKSAKPCGYAVVNLVSFIVADQCWSRFQGFSKFNPDKPSEKACEVSWSDGQQGLPA